MLVGADHGMVDDCHVRTGRHWTGEPRDRYLALIAAPKRSPSARRPG